jgi:hypothetical protein
MFPCRNYIFKHFKFIKMKTNQGKRGAGNPAKKEHSTGGNGNMEDSAFHVLFVNELRDIYWAEKQLVRVMPKWTSKAYSDELKEAIEEHLHETNEQVVRLEKVFERKSFGAQMRSDGRNFEGN